MNRLSLIGILVLVLAIALTGCGKSAEMKKMEADLFASVNKMHNDGMSLMTKATETIGKIDETVSQCEKFAADHPKETVGHNDADLKAAKAKLAAAVGSMKEWMSGFKPYDENMKHEDVLAQLEKSKIGITKVKADFEGALAGASAALDAHKAQADEIMAKMAKTVKKVGKK